MITQNLASTNFNALINTLSIQGYVIFDDFLAANIIIALRDEVDKRHINNEMVAAKTGLLSQLNPSKIRGDQICWLDEDSANINIQAYFAEMQALKMQLNQQLFMMPSNNSAIALMLNINCISIGALIGVLSFGASKYISFTMRR